MPHWFWSGPCQWWVAEVPPPETVGHTDEVVAEVLCGDPQEALNLVWRIYGDDPGAETGLLLEQDLPGTRLQRLTRTERFRMLAELIGRRHLRVWCKESLHVIALDGLYGLLPARPPAAPGPRPGPGKGPRPPGPSAAPAGAAAKSAAGGGAPRPGAPEPLHWYQFELIDELGDALGRVLVELTTPSGSHRLETNAAGIVRINQAPAGQGSARVDRPSLQAALEGRFARARRRSRPPAETADFKRTTPLRAGGPFEFPHERPHRVMVISRTDLVVAGADARWEQLDLAKASQPACGFSPGDLDWFSLCSRGSGESALVDGIPTFDAIAACDPEAAVARASATRAVYRVQRGDSLWAIAGKLMGNAPRWPEIRKANLDLLKNRPDNLIHPGELLQIPVEPAHGLFPDPGSWPATEATERPRFLEVDVDSLHESLFDQLGQRAFRHLQSPLVRLPPAPEPDWGSVQPAADAAAVLASVVAIDQGLGVELLLQTIEPPQFDPVEHAGPSRA